MIHRTPTLAALLILVAAVAGCVGDDAVSGRPVGVSKQNDATGQAESSAVPESADAPVGEIGGTVVDDSMIPIANATVDLDGETYVTITKEDGTFALTYVPTGTHELRVRKDGHLDHTSRVVVVEAERIEVKVTLVQTASAEEFVETKTQSGMVVCGASLRNPVTPITNTILICNGLGVDKMKILWTVPTYENITGLWIETTWKSTQALGDQLVVTWRGVMPGGDVRGGTYLGVFSGKNPLSNGMSRQHLEDYYVDANKKDLSQCSGKKCGMEGWHAAHASTLGSSSPVDFSIMINQAFDVYVTYFHRVPFPTTFTALPA